MMTSEQAPSIGGSYRRTWIFLAALGIPPALLILLLTGAIPNAYLVVPMEHFVIVTVVAVLALAVGLLLAIGTVRIGLYRLLFLTLGFMTMGGFFAVHGLATPGFILPNDPEYTRVIGISAFLSLATAGAFFALAFVPGLTRLERSLPVWPAGILVVLTAVTVVGYAGFALADADAAAESRLAVPPWSLLLAAGSLSLFCFSAYRQWQLYRGPRLRSQFVLILAFLLLAEAQVAMVISPVWSLAWWLYHLLMLAAAASALRALMTEMARGRSLRAILEGTFELDVAAGAELRYEETVAALAAAVEVKDRETAGHNVRVANYAVAIGRSLGLPAGDLRVLARAGLLHDVGKLGVPDAILRKPGKLDEAEWDEIRKHPLTGVSILERSTKLRRELVAILYHHERMDGSGYPHGLAGEAIPLEARIVAVADTYDVLTSDRPYRQGMSADRAREVLREAAGAHLDPKIVDALLWIVGADSRDALRSTWPPANRAL